MKPPFRNTLFWERHCCNAYCDAATHADLVHAYEPFGATDADTILAEQRTLSRLLGHTEPVGVTPAPEAPLGADSAGRPYRSAWLLRVRRAAG